MDRVCLRRLISPVCCLVTAFLAGCAELPELAWWPSLGEQVTDHVPGVSPPSRRLADLEELGRKAARSDPQQVQQVSAELARTIQTEEDPLIRATVIRTLGQYPGATADSVLRAALNDPDTGVRVAACEVWGIRAGPEAVTALSDALASDVDVDVRLAAARALGRTGDRAAIAALGEVLDDKDPALQYRAVLSLRSITGEDFDNDVNRWQQYVKGEIPPTRPPVSLADQLRRLF